MTQPPLDFVIAALEKIRESNDRLPRASMRALAQLQAVPAVAASPLALRTAHATAADVVESAVHSGQPQVSPGYTVGNFWKSRAHADGDADLPAVPGGTDRDYSAESVGRAGRSRSGRPAWNARNHAGIAWPLARLQRHPTHDHISPCLPAPKPSTFGKTQSL